MTIIATAFTLIGLLLTLAGAWVSAAGGTMTKEQIDERVDSMGRWWDEAPEWVRSDYARSTLRLRQGLWLIVLGTALQVAGTIVTLALS